MRKIVSYILVVVLSISAAGCGKTDTGRESGKLSIVTTVFPEYDWVMNILGSLAEKADVTMLADNGVDFHSYQPTASDIIRISACDVFIYAGGESCEWVEDALKEAVNKDMIVINLLDSIGDAAKEEVAGEIGKEDHVHEDEDGDFGHGHEEGPGYDEHVWLSLKNAMLLVNVIKDALIKSDPDSREVYASNAAAYAGKLDALDKEYQAGIGKAHKKSLVFGDRFPFRYLMDDYGISCYAAFEGCSAEADVGFETVTYLAGKIDELGLNCVLTLDGSDQRIAQAIIRATSAKSARILSMDSMQSVTLADTKKGTDYLSIMEKNMEVLMEALQ